MPCRDKAQYRPWNALYKDLNDGAYWRVVYMAPKQEQGRSLPPSKGLQADEPRLTSARSGAGTFLLAPDALRTNCLHFLFSITTQFLNSNY